MFCSFSPFHSFSFLSFQLWSVLYVPFSDFHPFPFVWQWSSVINPAGRSLTPTKATCCFLVVCSISKVPSLSQTFQFLSKRCFHGYKRRDMKCGCRLLHWRAERRRRISLPTVLRALMGLLQRWIICMCSRSRMFCKRLWHSVLMIRKTGASGSAFWPDVMTRRCLWRGSAHGSSCSMC